MAGYRHLFHWFRFDNYVYERQLFGVPVRSCSPPKIGLANRLSIGLLSDSHSVHSADFLPRQNRGKVCNSLNMDRARWSQSPGSLFGSRIAFPTGKAIYFCALECKDNGMVCLLYR